MGDPAFPYPFAALATTLAILVYVWTGFVVGAVRRRLDVPPPRSDGPPEFQRAWRAHQNTLEALPQILVALWLFAMVISDLWAGILTLVWAIGRVLYVRGYCADANKRFRGFAISSLAMLVMLFAASARVIVDLLLQAFG